MTIRLPAGRRAITGAVISCVAALAAGCGTSAGPAAGPAGTVTATPTATTPPAVSTSAPASSAAASSSAPPASAAACPTRSLGAKIVPKGAAAGSAYAALDFTNISTVTCTLYGYPGVSLAGGDPVSRIGLAATQNPVAGRALVTLAPGGAASALLQIVDAANYPRSRCDPVTATYLEVYPPNQTTPSYLRYTARACAKAVTILTVSVVVAGAGGPS